MMVPEKYRDLTDDELKARVDAVKKKYGKRLIILGHHYQTDSVYQFADLTGDSFKLARDAANKPEASFIVFCGVHFMAEAARIVCAPEQRVFIPDMTAGCPMADMADIDDVETAWEELSRNTDISKVIPVTYMNSTALIKAFCGHHGGAVCTSSNAKKIFEWALSQGEKIFFLPDEHLGRNTSRAMGIGNVSLWKHREENGGLDEDAIGKAQVFVWDGFCHVHTDFTVKHIEDKRREYPDCHIIVHPECREEVVNASDASGSTEQIKRYVEDAPEGSTVIVGTEINMVSRLANMNPAKKVVQLARSLCPNMFKISLSDLCWTLEELGEINEVSVPTDVARDAKLALDRMLTFGR